MEDDLAGCRTRETCSGDLHTNHSASSMLYKPVTPASGGEHLRELSLGYHIFEQTSERCRVVNVTVSDLARPGMEP